MGLSLAEKIAKLDPAERAKVLAGIEAEDLMYDPRFWLREEQLQCLDATEWLTGMVAGRGAGKAVVDDELIPTPTGFTAMGDLEVGDFVFDHAGRPTEVVGVFPQGEVPCARVTFSDKSSVVVSLDHLWTVLPASSVHFEYDEDWWQSDTASTVTTTEILGTRIPRQANTTIAIVAVEPVGDRFATCIKVAAVSELFLVGEAMVPTHNTRTGAEWIRDKAKVPNTRIALVARTAADVRDVMVQGQSGILSVCPPSEQPDYIPSARRLVWPNGSVAITYSAEEPNQLRGPQFNCAWADELSSWKFKPDDSGLTAWDNLQIATRLGTNPQLLITTTPKRVKAVRAILDLAKTDPSRVRLVRGSTMDNASNLSKAYLETITAMYAGTSIELQELYGEMLDAVEGALWNESQIPHISSAFNLDDLNGYLRIVGVDPSVAASPGDECGIVVVACTQEYQHYKRTGVVLDDKSLKADPDTWVQQVVATAKEWEAIVVAEQNQGFDLVRMAIKQADPTVPLVMVHASKGKAARAEPIVMAYQQGRVSHVGEFAELEDEMTGWVPGESGYSPNRLDALVWALSAGLVDDNAEVRKRVGALRGIMPSRDRSSVMTRRVPALAGRNGQYDTGPIRSGRMSALTAPWRR